MAFQIVYVVLLVALLVVRLRWHRRARVLDAGVVDVPEDWPIRVVRWLILPVWLFGMLGWPLSPESFAWQAIGLPVAVRVGGVVVATVGVALLVWVHETLGANFSPFLRIRADHELIATGPYRRVRHPMYTAFAMILAGLAALTDSAVLFVAVVLMVAAIAQRTRAEEAMLVARFGPQYEAYRASTGALLPPLFRA